MKKNSLFFAAFILFIFSCSDNSTNNINDGSPFFPDGIGTEWLYEDYAYDADQNLMQDSVYLIRAVLESHQSIMEKKASKIMYYSKLRDSDDEFTEDTEMFITEEASKIYAWSTALSSLAGNEFLTQFLDLEERWLLIADTEDDFWKIHEQEIPEIDLQIFKFEGSILITGEKGGQVNVSVKENTINAQEFITKVRLEGKISLENGLKSDVDADIIIRFYLSKGIGLVKQINENFTINTLLGEMPFPGSERILIDYTIK